MLGSLDKLLTSLLNPCRSALSDLQPEADWFARLT
jgi:hypothetical protein